MLQESIEKRLSKGKITKAMASLLTIRKVMDSACTYHLCPNRELFSSLQELKVVVYTGNNILCKIKGVDEVHLQMYDIVIRDFTEVWYILDMKKNHISLGVLVCMDLQITSIVAGLMTTESTLVVVNDTQ